MMGLALPHDDLPVVKATNCVIAASALDLQPRGRRDALHPLRQLRRSLPGRPAAAAAALVRAGRDLEALERYGLMDCIECGCCDYVCPSQIPLAERFRDMKPVARAADRATRAPTRPAPRFDATERTRLERTSSERAGTRSDRASASSLADRQSSDAPMPFATAPAPHVVAPNSVGRVMRRCCTRWCRRSCCT